jgi:hypothetical protein
LGSDYYQQRSHILLNAGSRSADQLPQIGEAMWNIFRAGPGLSYNYEDYKMWHPDEIWDKGAHLSDGWFPSATINFPVGHTHKAKKFIDDSLNEPFINSHFVPKIKRFITNLIDNNKIEGIDNKEYTLEYEDDQTNDFIKNNKQIKTKLSMDIPMEYRKNMIKIDDYVDHYQLKISINPKEEKKTKTETKTENNLKYLTLLN